VITAVCQQFPPHDGQHISGFVAAPSAFRTRHTGARMHSARHNDSVTDGLTDRMTPATRAPRDHRRAFRGPMGTGLALRNSTGMREYRPMARAWQRNPPDSSEEAQQNRAGVRGKQYTRPETERSALPPGCPNNQRHDANRQDEDQGHRQPTRPSAVISIEVKHFGNAAAGAR
jgi:hypothetical protein